MSDDGFMTLMPIPKLHLGFGSPYQIRISVSYYQSLNKKYEFMKALILMRRGSTPAEMTTSKPADTMTKNE